MEMRRYVRHSPAWWIVGGILALLTAGCIVLGLLAQRDSAAAEAVPIGDEIYLGDYNYIDVQYMTTWAYRVTLGDGRKLVFYLAEDTEGYGYLVQLSDAEYARYADIVDYTYADRRSAGRYGRALGAGRLYPADGDHRAGTGTSGGRDL